MPADSEPETESVATPRKIVLLSDGTGNSAGKANRTNVWRLYQALDLERADQIACYDDGVGTSGFKVLQILGGAFGWGLSRNVRDLYEFLCRHYRPGDEIYIFGFSRGAFTARVVTDMIGKCGVLDRSGEVARFDLLGRGYQTVRLNTDLGLRTGVELAYASYRRSYQAPLANLWRAIRDKVARPIPPPDGFLKAHSKEAPVRFVGVWDTVDAVGLPVDELSTMVDRLIYPHRFPDQDLSTKVERAAHAIAIDDERHTFHPVLWNERPREKVGGGTRDDSGRITQVWFTGMHSNVGGGYPDDDLAHVPLRWMIAQVEQAGGLHLVQGKLEVIDSRADPLGKMYDSRRGLASYYRYNPRNVAKLCHSPTVTIERPKLHRCVLDRIARTTVGHAPRGLPPSYQLVDDSGPVADQDRYESEAQRKARAGLLERAQHHIFWRRVLYFLMLLATLGLVLMPYYFPPVPGAEPAGRLEGLLAIVFGQITPFLPQMLEGWTDAWTQSPFVFCLLVLALIVLRWHNHYVVTNTQRLAEAAWWHVKRPEPEGSRPKVAAAGPFERLARMIQNNQRLQHLHRVNVEKVLPRMLMIVCVLVVLGAVVRAYSYWSEGGNRICAKWFDEHSTDQSAADRPTGVVQFSTSEACVETGVTLYAGQRYTIAVTTEGWQDASHEAGIAGIDAWYHRFLPEFIAGLPVRRSLMAPWFTLIGEIGRDSGETFPINRTPVTFRPTATGPLYLYVNDAIDPRGDGSSWTFYQNNQGSAEVVIEAAK